MQYLTAEQMAKVDELAVEKYSLTIPQMMENAGRNVARFIADELNNRIRVVDLQTGKIDTFVGNGQAEYNGDGGQAIVASLNRPAGLEFDEEGNLYVADTYNHCIRKINK